MRKAADEIKSLREEISALTKENIQLRVCNWSRASRRVQSNKKVVCFTGRGIAAKTQRGFEPKDGTATTFLPSSRSRFNVDSVVLVPECVVYRSRPLAGHHHCEDFVLKELWDNVFQRWCIVIFFNPIGMGVGLIYLLVSSFLHVS